MQLLMKFVVNAVVLCGLAVAFEPDCYTSTAAQGSDCTDPNLCVLLESGGDACMDDGARAAEFGYTRAEFAADEFMCQMNAFSSGFCNGDPSEGLDLEMRLTQKQLDIMEANKKTRLAAKPYIDYWPATDGYTVVPYVLADNAKGWTTEDLDNFHWALNWIQVNSKLRFVERTSERDYIQYINGSGCWSHVGKVGGGQQISLKQDTTCRGRHTVAHETYHALGILHEHVRSDRDEHIIIDWDEIQAGREHNYDIVEGSANVTPYDYGSLMHYGTHSFSVGTAPSLLPKDDKYTTLINTWFETPTMCDLFGLNKLYGGYNTAAGCTPNVIADICVPAPICVTPDCIEFCIWRCDWGIYVGVCQLTYTTEDLANLIDVHSGADNPLYYPLYDADANRTIEWGAATSTPTPIITTLPLITTMPPVSVTSALPTGGKKCFHNKQGIWWTSKCDDASICMEDSSIASEKDCVASGYPQHQWVTTVDECRRAVHASGGCSTLPTPTTSTRAPTTSTRAPTTSTRAPTTSTRAPTTSTRAPTTSTRAPTTSTRAPTTSTRAPSGGGVGCYHNEHGVWWLSDCSSPQLCVFDAEFTSEQSCKSSGPHAFFGTEADCRIALKTAGGCSA